MEFVFKIKLNADILAYENMCYF